MASLIQEVSMCHHQLKIMKFITSKKVRNLDPMDLSQGKLYLSF
jgi:hypothetical protein